MWVTARKKLLKRINDKSARIGIIGLGYVGLPLMLGFSEAGFPTLGFDIDPQKIDLLNAGKSYFVHIPDSRVSAATEGGLVATTQFSRAGETDVMILSVPTLRSRTINNYYNNIIIVIIFSSSIVSGSAKSRRRFQIVSHITIHTERTLGATLLCPSNSGCAQ